MPRLHLILLEKPLTKEQVNIESFNDLNVYIKDKWGESGRRIIYISPPLKDENSFVKLAREGTDIKFVLSIKRVKEEEEEKDSEKTKKNASVEGELKKQLNSKILTKPIAYVNEDINEFEDLQADQIYHCLYLLWSIPEFRKMLDLPFPENMSKFQIIRELCELFKKIDGDNNNKEPYFVNPVEFISSYIIIGENPPEGYPHFSGPEIVLKRITNILNSIKPYYVMPFLVQLEHVSEVKKLYNTSISFNIDKIELPIRSEACYLESEEFEYESQSLEHRLAASLNSKIGYYDHFHFDVLYDRKGIKIYGNLPPALFIYPNLYKSSPQNCVPYGKPTYESKAHVERLNYFSPILNIQNLIIENRNNDLDTDVANMDIDNNIDNHDLCPNNNSFINYRNRSTNNNSNNPWKYLRKLIKTRQELGETEEKLLILKMKGYSSDNGIKTSEYLLVGAIIHNGENYSPGKVGEMRTIVYKNKKWITFTRYGVTENDREPIDYLSCLFKKFNETEDSSSESRWKPLLLLYHQISLPQK